MDVKLKPIEKIKPYEKNPRINDAAVDAVAESIQRFGFRQPIVVDKKGVIVCGHTRWKAACKLGLAKVPVHVATDLTPKQIRAYRIADNKTAELAEWNLDFLSLELADLQDAGIDFSLLGFDADELASLFDPGAKEGLTDPDAVPEPPDKAITLPGDLWNLGDHRLLCGDSVLAADVDVLIAKDPDKLMTTQAASLAQASVGLSKAHGKSSGKLVRSSSNKLLPIHLVNTDPPYGVKVEPRSNNAIAAGNSSFPRTKRTHHQSFDVARQGEKKRTSKKLRAKDRPLINDFVSDEEFDKLLSAWFGHIARVLVPGRGFYIWGGYANCANYPPVLKASGLYFSQAIIWVKEHPVLTRKDFMGNHEWCFYGWKEGAAHHWLGPTNATDVWSVKKVNPQSMIHLTEKPVELSIRAMQYSSRTGENVLDLFGGSGSTLIAAEQTGRRAFLMELDALYCDVIVKRWEQFTGRKAKRQRRDTKRSA